MKDTVLRVISKRELADKVFELCFEYDGNDIVRAGQFVNLKIDGLYLRRPISVCDYGRGYIKVIIKEVGVGTKVLHGLCVGDSVVGLVGLGNGFCVKDIEHESLLIGGGVGVPPLYGLAKKMLSEGKKPKVILGFNGKADVFYEKEFKELGLCVDVYTVLGDYGKQGMVTAGIKNDSYVYACGPIPMLKALWALDKVKGAQLSLEERMGCGFGACMGCSIMTKSGSKRVCKDGPVFEKEELLW